MKSFHKRLLKCLYYNPKIGKVIWNIGTPKGPKGSSAGFTDKNGYLSIRFEKKLYQGHRLIWNY
jgi:hypothetical protein